MKNIFDYATRELSQDAFLRWLFENFDDTELKYAAGDLLNEFCAIDIQDIKDVNTTAQWCNIDISVWITLKDNSKAALFIEDKTYSEEHNQLDNYDNRISRCENEYARIYKIFYKTDIITDHLKDVFEREFHFINKLYQRRVRRAFEYPLCNRFPAIAWIHYTASPRRGTKDKDFCPDVPLQTLRKSFC